MTDPAATDPAVTEAAVTEAPLATMPVTRRAVLTTIKREGPLTAGELASRLGVSVPAMRQQLNRLSEDDLVVHRRQSEGRGRPAHVYELSESAQELFPKRYGDLTTELLGYLGGPGSAEVTKLFEQRGRRRLAEARRRLRGLSLPDQVAELARILDEDGYLADHRSLGEQKWLITEHNCAILSVAKGFQQACSSELGFIRGALRGARVERVAHLIDGAHVCAYEITAT